MISASADESIHRIPAFFFFSKQGPKNQLWKSVENILELGYDEKQKRVVKSQAVLCAVGKEEGMAISQKIWSLDDKRQLTEAELVSEKELEDFLCEHMEVLHPDWLLIGRQVRTAAGKYMDLLCMDHDGDLIVVELKKDLTPREVTAQVIDYASCVAELKLEELAELYLEFSGRTATLNEAYKNKFGAALDENSVNQNVKMVVVAAKMDDSTERIIRYLRTKYEVDINILFFQIFSHENKRLLSRVWFGEDVEEQLPAPKSVRSWNQEYYVSFGVENRRWEDARKYGFISAGGGLWYIKTLKFLEPGDRVWVNIPHTGYVGVGIVKEEVKPARDVRFDIDGNQLGFPQLKLKGSYLKEDEDPEKAEHVVKVEWIKTVSESEAVKELGFFGNQNTVCRPRDQKWNYTVDRLKAVWGIEDWTEEKLGIAPAMQKELEM